MIPIVEIASFHASEALLANPLLAKGALDIVNKVDGFISSRIGLQIEDGKTAYFAIGWESLEHHKKLQASPEYAEVITALKPAVAGGLKIHHVEFSGDHTKAFDAPVTELVLTTLKEGASRAELEALILILFKSLDDISGVHPPAVWGESKEEPNTFFIAIGWDSVEAHQDAIIRAKSTVAAKLAAIVDFVLVHVQFIKDTRALEE